MFDSDTLKALAIVAAIYFGARWFVADRPRLRLVRGGRKMKWPFRILMAVMFAALCFTTPGSAADLKDVVRVYGGINGVWFDGPATAFPSDFEGGGRATASLSPHVSVGSSVYYGFRNSYVRWEVGPRITVTDAEDPNFSVGLGAAYHGGSEPSVLPQEWVADASFGWRVAPVAFPRLIVVGQGGYGFTTSRARGILGLRWLIPL
jgi:hypothetical protein